MEFLLLLGLIAAIIALQVFLIPKKRKKQRRTDQRKPYGDNYKNSSQNGLPYAAEGHLLSSVDLTYDDEPLYEFPYTVSRRFLSPAELNYFQTLRRVVGQHGIVCSKVSLGDVFQVNVSDKRWYRAYRNKIDRKHVDFLLCDPATMHPILGIELDDKSHQRPDRQERDAFVDQVFQAAGLPLLHVPVQRAYRTEEVRACIAPYLRVPVSEPPRQPAAVPVPAPSIPQAPAQICPKCGGEMILRTAKKGTNAGAQFWGCSNYPTCRTMLRFEG